MFDEKTILARLQNGEDAQTIADEMAAMINAANKTYADQKAAEEAARKAEEAKKATDSQKKADLQDILDQLQLWFAQYYEIEDLDKVFEELNAETVLELIEAVEEYAKAMNDLKNIFGVKPAVKPVRKNVKAGNPDDVINSFLKDMGW